MSFHRGWACQTPSTLGGALKVALDKANEGQAIPLGSLTRESASATVLCSDGKCATVKVHLLRASPRKVPSLQPS